MITRRAIFLYLLFLFPLKAQTIDAIKSDPNYFYGESTAQNEEAARDKALANLATDIAPKIKSQFTYIKSETESDYNENVKEVIQSYSSAALTNVDKIIEPAGGKIRVFYYIKKSEVDKIFLERKNYVENLFRNAEYFERTNNFGDALKNYYYGSVLLHSLPSNSATIGGINLSPEIALRINSILSKTRIEVQGEKILDTEDNLKEKLIDFKVTVDGKPAEKMQFAIWDGSGQTNVAVKDGRASCKLVGPSVEFDELKINIEYQYYGSRNEHKIVAQLWDLVVLPEFQNLYKLKMPMEQKELPLPPPLPMPVTSVKNAGRNLNAGSFAGKGFNLKVESPDGCTVLDKISEETFRLLSVLKSGSSKKPADAYSDDEFLSRKISDLIKYNRITIKHENIDADIFKTYEGWELRRINVLNNYRSIKTQSDEFITLDFTPEGKLYDLNYEVFDRLYSDYVLQNPDSTDAWHKQVMIRFMEKYRTAFLSRDINIIDSMFAEEAVIIIGRVPKKTNLKDVYGMIRLNDETPDFETTRYSKEQYLINQKRVFATQQDIYLGFTNLKIHKKNSDDLTYGISLRQNYSSTGYGDEGHLFLLIDFKNQFPQIYVRAWQPNEWSDSALLNISNFSIYGKH
ncbi:MAG: hypothetical protein K9I69_04235 [Ignavibacteriales bacterium]|nr:hypothetical protein [Ignavibacteriales bacterium]